MRKDFGFSIVRSLRQGKVTFGLREAIVLAIAGIIIASVAADYNLR
jgi:hypothetical protein